MSAPLIIGLVGEQGSGKGTFATLLASAVAPQCVAVIRFSDVVRETLKLWSIPETRENLQRFAQVIMEHFKPTALSDAVAARAQRTDAAFVVLDGIRRLADAAMVREIPGSIMVYITAPAEFRYQRLRSRGENVGEHGMSFEQFLAAEHAPAEAAIPTIGATADHRIENAGTLDEYGTAVARAVHLALRQHA